MKKTIIISAIVIGTALVAGFALIWLLPARSRSHASDGCASHLSQLGKLFQMYAIDHNGSYPGSWQEAHDYLASWPEYSSPKIFVCRRSGQIPGPTNQVDSWCSFLLVSRLTTNSPKDRVHACCLPEHHQGKGASVLLTDGSVRMYRTDDFHKLLREQGIQLPQQKH